MSKNSILREIAALLPGLPKHTKGKIQTNRPYIVVTGKQILEEPEKYAGDAGLGVGVIDGKLNGKAIDYNGRYKFDFAPRPILVDHFKEMKKTINEAGRPGLIKYIDIVYNFNKQTRGENIDNLLKRLEC